MKSLPAIVIIIVVGLLIFAGVKHFVIDKPPPAVEKPVVTSKVSPAATRSAPPERSVATTTVKPASIEQDLASLREAVAEVIAGGESKQVTLVITESEANEQAASLLTQDMVPEDIPLELKGVRIDFQVGNSVLTEIETTIMGVTVKIKVKSQVSIKEGKPAVAVTEINFGFILLPASLKDQLADFIRGKTGEMLDRSTTAALAPGQEVDIIYQEIDIQEEKATVTVLIRPKA